jgi:hypothetical protein
MILSHVAVDRFTGRRRKKGVELVWSVGCAAINDRSKDARHCKVLSSTVLRLQIGPIQLLPRQHAPGRVMRSCLFLIKHLAE